MSKKSAVDTIKKLNPKNVSGVIPQALDMMQNLKKIKDNPFMIDAVGPQQLMGAMKHIQKLFEKKKSGNQSNTAEEQAVIDRIEMIKNQIEGALKIE